MYDDDDDDDDGDDDDDDDDDDDGFTNRPLGVAGYLMMGLLAYFISQRICDVWFTSRPFWLDGYVNMVN